MYIVPVVVMATLTTEAILTILGHGKQSEYPGFRDTLTIPGLYRDEYTPHTTPLVRVSWDPEIL